MKTGPLWKITVSTTSEAEEAISALLEKQISHAVSSYTDVESGEVLVSAYVRKLPRGCRAAILTDLDRISAAGLSVGPGRISASSVRRRDWAESWKRHFKPIAIGSALLIKPSWSRRRSVGGQATVVLDPGLSFGTGHHPTTEFCLEQIVARREGASVQSFLDIGTGSGILAIAAAKLGYKRVDAFDFDPAAVRVAGVNARKNRVRHSMQLKRGDVTRLPQRAAVKYDLVCANLISTLLLSERERIASRVRPGGWLVLAGILDAEFCGVKCAYEELGFRLLHSRKGKEWRSGTFQKLPN